MHGSIFDPRRSGLRKKKLTHRVLDDGARVPRASKPEREKKQGDGIAYRRFFKHYITGVVYDAHDFGHDFWPIGKSKQ